MKHLHPYHQTPLILVIFNQLTWLIAQEDFIKFSPCESSRSYMSYLMATRHYYGPHAHTDGSWGGQASCTLIFTYPDIMWHKECIHPFPQTYGLNKFTSLSFHFSSSGLVCINICDRTLQHCFSHKMEYFTCIVTELCLWSRILSFTKMYLIVKASRIFNNL